MWLASAALLLSLLLLAAAGPDVTVNTQQKLTLNPLTTWQGGDAVDSAQVCPCQQDNPHCPGLVRHP